MGKAKAVWAWRGHPLGQMTLCLSDLTLASYSNNGKQGFVGVTHHPVSPSARGAWTTEQEARTALERGAYEWFERLGLAKHIKWPGGYVPPKKTNVLATGRRIALGPSPHRETVS